MSYIQIQLGGELRGLKFNQLTYITFYKEVDQNNYEGTFHYAAVWAALKANAYVKRIEFTQTWETVCDWVDIMTAEDKDMVQNEFSNSATFKSLVKDGEQNQEEEPAKKKILENTMMTV